MNYVNVLDHGAVGDGITDCHRAIESAIESLEPPPGAVQGHGGCVFFPPGVYRFNQTLKIVGTNIRFEGAGSRFGMNFKRAPSTLLYGGSEGHGIEVAPATAAASSNNTRGFQVRDLAIEYRRGSGFRGVLLAMGSVGCDFQSVSFGDDGLGHSGRAYSAEALVKVTGTEALNFTRCCFDVAKKGVSLERNSGMTSNIVALHGCLFFDFVTAGLWADGGGHLGLSVTGCAFDPIDRNLLPKYGALIRANGFSITGSTFMGATANIGPYVAYLDVEGRGVINGNYFNTWRRAIRCRGNISMNGNRIVADRGVDFHGGILTGSANDYDGPERDVKAETATKGNAVDDTAPNGPVTAVYLAPDGYQAPTCVALGPDSISPRFDHSYTVGSSSEYVGGRILRSRYHDQSGQGIRGTEHLEVESLP